MSFKTNIFKRPNFFAVDIIELLKKHNKLNLIKKNYFLKDNLVEIHSAFVVELVDYLKLFKSAKESHFVLGEASVSYLYSFKAAKEIYKFNPDAKILAILRDPIERAYSHYIMDLRDGLTTGKDFVNEVLNDFKKAEKGWGISHLYVELGLYYNQLKRYLDIFPKRNVKIVLFEELKSNAEKTIREIFEFLGINPNVEINFEKKENVGVVPQNLVLNKFVQKIRKRMSPHIPKFLRTKVKGFYKKVLFQEKPKLTSRQRKILMPFFKEDIEKTQKLINRDLSDWLKV